jgi:hypothetical protein
VYEFFHRQEKTPFRNQAKLERLRVLYRQRLARLYGSWQCLLEESGVASIDVGFLTDQRAALEVFKPRCDLKVGRADSLLSATDLDTGVGKEIYSQ